VLLIKYTRIIVPGISAAAKPDRKTICFGSRHGLQVESTDQAIDVVTCFEYLNVCVYEDGSPAGQPADGFGTSDVPVKLFNEAVLESQLPLPPPAH